MFRLHSMFTRRSFLTTGSLATIGTLAAPHTLFATSIQRFTTFSASFAQLEKDTSGRLGVAVLDTASGERAGHRSAERFAMCSTFKMLLAAAILQRVDRGKEDLDRPIDIPAAGFLGNSPITQAHAGGTLTLRELCAAIVTRSDNTGANILLNFIGGPSGITRLARTLEDTVTRLDRTETSLNQALPGDPRDTTSPAAIVRTWQKLLLGNSLSLSSRQQLTDWLIANKTGDERLRAGFNSGWRAGDKTGSNGDNTSNDIAILWPPNQAPILIAVFLTQCPGPESKRGAAIAEVGRLVTKAIHP